MQVLPGSLSAVTEKLSDAEMDAWQALLHAHERIVTRLDAELRAEHGLGLSEYDVSGLTRVVDRLERDALVARRRDSADARVVFAELTEHGRQRLRAAARTHLRGIREHFTGRLTLAQLRNVASALQVITGPHQPH